MVSLRELPADDEVEVSLFGPGVGECVVIHIGGGEWVVVDSCIDRATGRPSALRYLQNNLGIDPAGAVRLLVVTHWHDDHIRGMSEIFKTTRNAQIVCSGALNTDEFYQLVAASDRALLEAPGTEEFAEILDELRARAPHGSRPATIGPKWAHANQRLWQRAPGASVPGVQVFALSPSAASATLAMHTIAALLPQLGTPKRRAVALGPNEAAVALWIEVGAVRVLLGSDLETSPNPAVGWKAIVASNARPQGRAHVFKVPHHGSANADDPMVWALLLVQNPYALLTPFTKGRGLPTGADVARLRERTPNGYRTAQLGGWAPPRRDAAVEKTLREVAIARKALTGPTGHIRLRVPNSNPGAVQVALFNGASAL